MKRHFLTISKQIELDYGHTLQGHYSFCSQIHGHRAKVIATVKGVINKKAGASDEGMVLDFKFLKETMMSEIHEKIDHGFAVYKKDTRKIKVGQNPKVEVSTLDFIKARNKKVLITEEPPTAEYLAKWAFERLLPHIPKGITLVKVDWYETPNSVATYEK